MKRIFALIESLFGITKLNLNVYIKKIKRKKELKKPEKDESDTFSGFSLL